MPRRPKARAIGILSAIVESTLTPSSEDVGLGLAAGIFVRRTKAAIA
jgi:hypothetical protein